MDSLHVWKNSLGGTPHAAISLDDGNTIFASDGSSVSRWIVDAGRVETVSFEGNSAYQEAVLSVSISPNGRLVATAASDRTVTIWQAKDGKVLWGPLEGHADGIYALCFSTDSKMIVSGSDDRNVRIWSAETGQIICGPMEGHTGSVKGVCFRCIITLF
jgi:WD40 repeat protein